MELSQIYEGLLLVAAICTAIGTIYNFFLKGKKDVKKKTEQYKQQQLAEERCRTEATINELLPAILLKHDLETREKYLADRERYLKEIKNEVVKEVRDQLDSIEEIKDDMVALADSARDVLREKIMAIYHKNKRTRTLEEHEREALTQYYKDYKKIGGNSYIDKYFARMGVWEVIPDDYDYNEE